MDRTRLLSITVCLLALFTPSLAQEGAAAATETQDPSPTNPPGTSPPKIVNQSPSYFVVLPKEPTEIECEAEGTPAPTYKWQKDGADLEMTGVYTLNGGNLQVRRPTEMTNGIYRCFAMNSYGVAMSNKIDFQIAFTDPFRDKEKTTFTFRQGDQATIPCNQGDSVPAPSIFWTDDANPGNEIRLDNRVSIDPDYNLRFSHINVTDTGNYQCNVKSDKLRVQLLSPLKEVVVTPVANIDPRPAAFVYTPEPTAIAFRTEQLRLKCMAEGYPTPAITWEKEGETLPADRTTFESYGQEMVISDVVAADAGSYICTASNGAGTPSTFKVTVTIKSFPYWENKPEDTNIAINDNGVLDCAAEGIPVPMVTWLVNGVPYKDAEPNPHYTITEGIGGGRVVVADAVTEDSAVFVCMASNQYGEIFASGFLNVESIPAEMTDAPTRNLNTIEGRGFDLACAGQGSPKPNIQWSFQNNPIADGESKYSIVESGNTRITTSTLTVTGVDVDDSGDYKCTIENGFAAVDATSTVDVRKGTTIVVGPDSEVSVELGQEAIVTCEVDHDVALTPTVTWLRDIGSGEEVLDLTVPGGRFRRAKTGSDNLKVMNTVEEDTGTYTCRATTTDDEASASTELIIKTVPAPPSKPTVTKRSDISDTMVAVHWSGGDDGNSPITDYIVSYMTNFPDLGWVTETTVPATASEANVELSPYVTYRLRIVAVNEIGESQPSELSDEYTTEAAAIKEAPTEVGLEATDPGKLKVTWPEVHPVDQNGPGFKYIVRWKEEGGEWQPIEITDYRTTEYEIDGGDNYKELQVEVIYKNDLGAGPASVVKSGFTGEGTPTQAPQNVEVTSESPTEVLITWDPVPPESINGQLQKYLIYYEMEEIQAQGQQPAECLPNTDCRVGDLTPYMAYQFQVAVRNGQREGEKSAPVSFKMPEGQSGPVFQLSVVPLSDRVLVKWGKPASPNGVIKGYNISYSTFDGSDVREVNNVPLADPEATSYKVSPANPDTNYRITVYATNGFGLGVGETVETKTRVGGKPPEPMLDDSQIEEGEKEINVTFVQRSGGAAANSFYILYKPTKDEEAEDQETKPMDLLEGALTTVSGLSPLTEYTLVVVAVNDEGQTRGREETVTTIGIIDPEKRASPIYVQAWFIVLLIIIVALLCILLVLCILKSQRGGKYNVSDKEQQRKGDIESTPLKDEGGFEEFEPRKDHPDGELPRGSQGSLQDSEPGSSDTDSLKEYADGELGKFNEEGSFIGQYGDKKQRPTDDNDQGGAAYSTFV